MTKTTTTQAKPKTTSTAKNTATKIVAGEDKIKTLEDSLAQLTNMFTMFMQQNNKTQTIETPKTETKPTKKMSSKILTTFEDIPDIEYEEIPPNKKIRIKSLFKGTLNLNTNNDCTGVFYKFANFGDEKQITYSDLCKILDTDSGLVFAQRGYYYIMNKAVVSNHNLNDIYNSLLPSETIENFMDLSIEEISDVFDNISDGQKEQLYSVIVEKIYNKEKVDLNKLAVLSRLYGRDIQDSVYVPDEKEK